MPEAAKVLAVDALDQLDLGGLARGVLGGSIGFGESRGSYRRRSQNSRSLELVHAIG